jgi:hypothetical protein
MAKGRDGLRKKEYFTEEYSTETLCSTSREFNRLAMGDKGKGAEHNTLYHREVIIFC